jgi:hypothetical protein
MWRERVSGCLRPKASVLRFPAVLLLFIWGLVLPACGALQFDVFFGYDGIVPEASWVPVVCEIKNDGPAFTGTIELSPGNGNQGQTSRLTVELPTGTLKRLVMPVFGTRGYTRWDIRLLDERGKLRSEQLGLGPRKQLAQGTPLLGALPRTAGGTPVIKPTLSQSSELQPAAARILPSIFPDNPLVLEGLSCLYLNSERATELTKPQVNAILAWLNAGGHLVVAVEQPSDVTSSPWLRDLFPCEVKDLKPLAHHTELESWLRNSSWPAVNSPAPGPRAPGRVRLGPTGEGPVANPFSSLPSDLDFEAAEMQVAVGTVREGVVEVAAGDTPLIVTAHHGRGRLTALLFSPEREPVRSWKNLGVFWAKLAEVPAEWYLAKDFNPPGGWSSDGIFGAMIDSRQVHKLPVGWLLLLLLVYLVVIGPLDQFWLKKIGKPMLTWITFPCYVVLFSLVIYFIGYKLRAGESEWNELHLVDVLMNGERDELRGRTFSSVYSPANQRYGLSSSEKYATLRGEFIGWGGASSDERTTVIQKGDGFNAEIFVPVWTSELLVSDWWQSAAVPLRANVQAQGTGWRISLDNRTDRKLTAVYLAVGDRIISLGEVPGAEARTFTTSPEQGILLRNFVREHGANFQQAVTSRQRALGTSERGQISDLPNASIAASFLSQILYEQNLGNNFIAPPGLDLSPVLQQGGAVLLAWADDFAPVKPMNQFTPRRNHRSTLWRVPVTIQ